MKKPLLFFGALTALLFSGLSIEAQESAPNRLIVTANGNMIGGYAIDFIDDLRFYTVEGDVQAIVELGEITTERVELSITRTPACESFSIAVVAGALIDNLNDAAVITYMQNYTNDKYYQDFGAGSALTGINLQYGTDYSIVTVGYDELGIAAGVYRAPFRTPDPVITGHPYVEATIDEVTLTSYTLTFVPNADVSEYYLCSFHAGTIEQNFQMYGAMMGYANVNEMIAGFAWYTRTGTVTYTWDGEEPGTDYEIAIAIKDLDGNFVPYQTVPVSTLSLGGEGEAFVDIEPGDYSLEMWYDEILPSQFFYFWPNENTARYRMTVFLAEVVEEYGVEALSQDLCQEPPMPNMLGWYHYEPLCTDYQIDPSTEVYVFAAGQNVNNQWGEVNVLQYTTADDCEGYAAFMHSALASKDKKVASRINAVKAQMMQSGKAPVLKERVKMTLQAK